MSDRPDPGSGQVINDGRWMPGQDPLTIRHGGRADATFADGHVQAVTPDFGADVEIPSRIYKFHLQISPGTATNTEN